MDLAQSFASVMGQYHQQLPWLHSNTIFLSVHGSHAYGTNIESSDWDLRGVCIPPKEYYLNPFMHFEQADKFTDVDCTIFGLNKFMQLAINNNPNVLEILFTVPEEHLVKNKFGQILIDNRELFLSKKARWTFSGYAIAQLKRIKTHKRYLDNPPSHQPTRAEFGLSDYSVIPVEQLEAAESLIKSKLDSWNPDFSTIEDADRILIEKKISDVCVEIAGASLYINKENLWKCAAISSGISPGFIQNMIQERAYRSRLAEWHNYQEWQINRNPARAELEAKYGFDSKHAMHLVRLLTMCKEILLDGQMIVKRPDAKFLLEIRNGKLSYDELVTWAENMDKEMDNWYEKSPLPKNPDIKKIGNLTMQLTEEFLAQKSF